MASYCRWLGMSSLSVIFLFFNIVLLAEAAKNNNFCNVCRAVIDEAKYKIADIDPTKTIKVGSYRVYPDGQQKHIKERAYARSESQIEEMFESICDSLKSNYGEMKLEDGSVVAVRTNSQHGQDLDTSNPQLDMTASKRLSYQCQNFLEDHEEVVMGLLQRDDLDDYEKVICGTETNVCSEQELSVPIPQLPARPEEDYESESDSSTDEEKETEEDSNFAKIETDPDSDYYSTDREDL